MPEKDAQIVPAVDPAASEAARALARRSWAQTSDRLARTAPGRAAAAKVNAARREARAQQKR